MITVKFEHCIRTGTAKAQNLKQETGETLGETGEKS